MTLEALDVRKATLADLEPMLSLLTELNRGLQRPVDTQPADWRRNLSQLVEDPDAHVLVAVVGGEIAGLLTVGSRVTLLHRQPVGLIYELVVAEAFRGKGVGRALTNSAAELAQQLGWAELEVSTEAGNQAAIAFYRSCGFTEEAVLLEREFDQSAKDA